MKKSFKAVVSEHLTRKHSENRYVVVSVETGNVLEDNKGEGFTTESKAIHAYEVKHFTKTSKDLEKLAAKRRRDDVIAKTEAHQPNEEELIDLLED